MISALVISALYLLGMKLFYEYDQEVMPETEAVRGFRNVLWYALWPVLILIATVQAALDKGVPEDADE